MEIAFGELMWAMARGALYSAAFLVIMVLMDLTTAGLAVHRVLRRDAGRVRVRRARHGDVDVRPQLAGLRPDRARCRSRCSCSRRRSRRCPSFHSPVARFVIQLSPLYQAVVLVRGITLDQLSAGLLGHVGLPGGDGRARSAARLPPDEPAAAEVAGSTALRRRSTPSMRSRIRSAWPLCRAYSSIMWL